MAHPVLFKYLSTPPRLQNMDPFIAFGGARPCLDIFPTPLRLQNMDPFIAFGGARPCLDIFPTPLHLQNMDPFIAFGGARPLARLGHVCSHLFSWMVNYVTTGWPHDHGPTNVGAKV